MPNFGINFWELLNSEILEKKKEKLGSGNVSSSFTWECYI